MATALEAPPSARGGSEPDLSFKRLSQKAKAIARGVAPALWLNALSPLRRGDPKHWPSKQLDALLGAQTMRPGDWDPNK